MSHNVEAALRRVVMAYRRPLFDIGNNTKVKKHRTCGVRKRGEFMYIYAVYNPMTKLTKIGITEDLDRRVRQIERGIGGTIKILTWADVEFAAEMEKFIHALLSEYRTIGEWFELDENAWEYFKDVWYGIFEKPHEDTKENKPTHISFTIPVDTFGDWGSFIHIENKLEATSTRCAS